MTRDSLLPSALDAIRHGRLAPILLGLVLVFTLPATVRAELNNPCDAAGEAPDVVTGDISARTRWGSVGDITAFSFGATSCNVGTCWLSVSLNTAEHPLTAQNIFRFEDGRFEQIGQSWVMHAFFALSQSYCSSGCLASDGAHLGVNCSNADSANFGGYQPRLGPKSEVDAWTGTFPFPATAMNQTGNAIYKRLQVHTVDLDPAQYPGASYWGEVQFIAHDDASGGNGSNNASYRPLAVTGASGNFDLVLTGTTVRGKPAIEAWRAIDPGVVLTNVAVPGDGELIVAARVSSTGSGYHYEYAVQNLNANRSVGSFSAPVPAGGSVTGIGFHDVDYHSGEPISGADWPVTVGPNAIVWTTESYVQNANANALRWGTLYNFRFDSPVPPTPGPVTLGLYRPGDPAQVEAMTLVPCSGADADADARASACDCDDANAQAWATPGEAIDLRVFEDPLNGPTLAWSPPAQPGGSATVFDVIRSASPSDFVSGAVCIPTADPQSVSRADAQAPPAGGLFAYLVRARNACPAGSGPLGTNSSGVPRSARTCP